MIELQYVFMFCTLTFAVFLMGFVGLSLRLASMEDAKVKIR